jgi:hypothetical protein
MRRGYFRALCCSATLLGACGDDDDGEGDDKSPVDASAPVDAADPPDAAAPPDAGGDDAAAPDAMPPPFLGCAELAAPEATLSTFPATHQGDLAGEGADLQVLVECTFVHETAGISTIGIDEVIALTGLTPGTRYFARLESEGDMLIDVITGCTDGETTSGPAEGECLAFADAIGAGTEALRFIAPADGKVHVIVDTWVIEPPDPTTYTLTVTSDGCLDVDDCPVSAPFCGAARECTAIDYCVGDDTEAEERSDDTPAGATVLDLSGGPVTIDANICRDSGQSNPAEADYYVFTVEDAASVTLDILWPETATDIDVAVYAADLAEVGRSYYQNPEIIAFTHLPAGSYVVEIVRFEPDDSTVVTPYSLTATAGSSTKCTSTADCAETFDKQRFRGTCDVASGACVAIAGAGALALGAACDSADDCASGACSNFGFQADADTRSLCTHTCSADTDCAAVDPTAKCSTGLSDGNNLCFLPCTAQNQCPVRVNPVPTEPDLWKYVACNVAEGRCAF